MTSKLVLLCDFCEAPLPGSGVRVTDHNNYKREFCNDEHATAFADDLIAETSARIREAFAKTQELEVSAA